MMQNFHCTFDAFSEIMRQLWCADLVIDSALLFIAAVFSPVRIVDLVQVGSERVFHDVTGHETLVMLTFNHHCCTDIFSSPEISFLVLLHVATLQTN